jgi:hypothetical protein
MTPRYVRFATGNDTNDGLGWATAKATIGAALTASAAGDVIYVDKNQNATGLGTVTLNSPGTAASPVRIICVDSTGDPTPPTTRATSAVIAATAAGGVTLGTGFGYVYGIAFKSNVGGALSNVVVGTNNGSGGWVLEDCSLQLPNTSATSRISLGILNASNKDSYVELINTTVSFGNAGQAIHASAGRIVWRNVQGSAVLGTAPTGGLFSIGGTGDWGSDVTINGVDLSAVTVALVNAASFGTATLRFNRCRLASGVLATTGAIAGPGGVEVFLDQCSDSATSTAMHWERHAGTIDTETTLVKTGGATDGTTTISWKMVGGSGAGFNRPLASPWIEALVETVGSPITFGVDILSDSATNLKDDQVWLEVEYLGTSSYPLASYASDRAANVLVNIAGTASDQAASTATWTTTGMTNPNRQKCEVTVTPQRKGAVRARVMLATAATVYANPALNGITSSRQFLAPGSGAFYLTTGPG